MEVRQRMHLNDIVVNFLGDSITEGHGVANVVDNRFDNRLARLCGIVPRNYGIGGTRIAHQRRASEKARWDLCFCGRAFDMDKDAGLIVVYGGTNDYGHGDAPFGRDDERTPETYCGAVHYLIDVLRQEYPNARIVFLTPARRVGDEIALPIAGRCVDKKPLVAYADEILLAAGRYGIPVFDLYRDLGIDPNDPVQRDAYTSDGLHLNDEGHGVLAEKLARFLSELPD